jgi:hypothetical protein
LGTNLAGNRINTYATGGFSVTPYAVNDVISFIKPRVPYTSGAAVAIFDVGTNTLNSDGTTFYKVSVLHSTVSALLGWYEFSITNYDGSATGHGGGPAIGAVPGVANFLIKQRDKFTIVPLSSTAWKAKAGHPVANFGGTFTSGTYKFVGKAHSYSQAELFDGNYFNLGSDNQGDTTMFSCATQWPKKLVRTSNAVWRFGTHRAAFGNVTLEEGSECIEEGASYPYFKDGPYLPEDSAPDGKSAGIGLQGFLASGAFKCAPSVLTSSDVGRGLRITPPNADLGTKNYYLTTVTNGREGTGVFISGASGGNSGDTSDQIRLGAYSVRTGYPYKVAFFQNRLVFAGTNFDSFRVDCSKANDYINFAPTNSSDLSKIGDNYAITLTPESRGGELNGLAVAGVALFLLGSNDLFAVYNSAGSQTLSPAGCVSTSAKNMGAVKAGSAVVGSTLFYIGGQGRKLYSAEFDGMTIKVTDRSLLSSHILEGGVLEMAYQSAPFSIIWMVRADGVLVAYTVDDTQQIASFSKHTIGGAFGSGTAVVESIASLPADNSPHSDLWMIVKRTINNATVRHIEKLSGSHIIDDTITQNAVVCSDSSVTYSGSATVDPFTTELLHLRGSTLALVADGKVITGKTASATGALSSSLSATASTVVAGLSYTPEFETTSLEVMGQNGPSVGMKKRINKITIGVKDTSWLTVGPTSSDQKNIETGNAIIPTSAKITWTTQGYTQQFAGDITSDARVYIKQPYPLPICITYINAEGEIYAR